MRGGRHFTLYWKWDVYAREERDAVGHAASNYLDKCGVAVGDVVWVVTFEGGALHLGGRLEVGWIGSKEEAARRLGTTPDQVFDRRTHVLAAAGTVEPARLINLAPYARSIRFVGESDRLPEGYSGKHFQSMRELAPESIRLLEDIWRCTPSAVTSPKPSLDDFDPTSAEDAAERVERSIMLRRGQPAFRVALKNAYDRRCAITGCDADEALEAAHIVGYSGAETNHPQNGLLLRADIHTLFDRDLIAVDTATWQIVLHPSLMATTYNTLAGQSLKRPDDPTAQPSKAALDQHRRDAGL